MIDLRPALLSGLDACDVAPGAAIAVACSGGPDSLALADLLQRERGGRVGQVSLVYVDHRLRSTEHEQILVEEIATRWGLPYRIEVVDVDRGRPSLEAAAREARYPALEHAASELAADLIATGHTASDQAETVIMRVIRGTGVEGLAGIAPRRGRIIRPLLEVGRSQILDYLSSRDLEPAVDPTNDERVFARNRVRHDIVPLMVAENPRIEDALCRLARSARELRHVVDVAADDLADRADREGALSAYVLASAPPLLAKRALAAAAAAAGAGTLDADHLEALWDLASRPPAGSMSVDLPKCVATREYDAIHFGSPTQELATPERPLQVRGPGSYQVRRWQPGDRMRPARLGGRSRKLSDLYIDAKVPRRLRERARVVVRSADGVIEWAEHLGLAYQSPVEVE